MKKSVLCCLLAATVSLSACYDQDEQSRNPYALPDNTTSAEVITHDTTYSSPYADIDISYTVSQADSVALASELADAPKTFRNFLYEGCYNDYQITTNLSHDIYCGFVANNQPKHATKTPDYMYSDGWSAARWRHFYVDRCAEYRQLLRAFKFNPQARRYTNQFYITRIYMAFLAQNNTDTYGDMPFDLYAQALLPETNNVPYNTQQQVYDMMLRMLEQAVDSIRPDDNTQYSITDDDICYFGDVYKWLRFANTLRLRMAMRIVNVDPERARQEAVAALSNSYGLMQSNDDNMQTVPRYAPLSMGGEDSGGSENVIAMCSVAYGGECVMSKDLEQLYRNLSAGGTTYTVRQGTGRNATNVEKTIDPRCIVCWYRANMTASTWAAGEESLREDYVGCERGAQAPLIDMGTIRYSTSKTAPKSWGKPLNPDYFLSYERPSVWLSYSESLFLKAEAVLRGWQAPGLNATVEEYFRQGVQASMDYYGIAEADARSYINGLYCLADGTFSSSDRERILETIITQKWLAVFPNGNEGWADFRRCDYPAIALQLTNNSGGDVPQGKHIKRLLYPLSENSNKAFTGDTRLQAVNTQGTRLWWDVSDTNDDSGQRQQPDNFKTTAR